MSDKTQDDPKLFSQFSFVLDLEELFKVSFTEEQFYNLIDTFAIVGNVNNQQRTFNLFKTLAKEEVVRRASIVSRLHKVLININNKRTYVISNTFPT